MKPFSMTGWFQIGHFHFTPWDDDSDSQWLADALDVETRIQGLMGNTMMGGMANPMGGMVGDMDPAAKRARMYLGQKRVGPPKPS